MPILNEDTHKKPMHTHSHRKKSIDPSPEIQALARKEELGAFLKTFPVSKYSTGIWKAGIACIVFGITLNIMPIAMIILMATSPAPGSEPMPKDENLILWIATIPGFVLLVVGFFLIFLKRLYFPWGIYLWQYGFIYKKKQIITVFRWDYIESIKSKTFISESHTFTYKCKVRNRDGYEATLNNNFADIAELIDIVLTESARHLASYELIIPSPQRITTFDNFKLDRQGISSSYETLFWQEIREFITKKGAVTITK